MVMVLAVAVVPIPILAIVARAVNHRLRVHHAGCWVIHRCWLLVNHLRLLVNHGRWVIHRWELLVNHLRLLVHHLRLLINHHGRCWHPYLHAPAHVCTACMGIKSS